MPAPYARTTPAPPRRRVLRFAALAAIPAAAIAGPACLRAPHADAAPAETTLSEGPTPTLGRYGRYTRRLEDEAFRILAPEIDGATRSALATHALDLWGSMTIGEWRQGMLRWAPGTEKALTVLVRRTEVLFQEEQVDEAYGSAVLQLGSVHAMQKGVTRILDASGATAPAPLSAKGIGGGTPVRPLRTPDRAPEAYSSDAPLAPTPSGPAPVRIPQPAPVYSLSVPPPAIAVAPPSAPRALPPAAPRTQVAPTFARAVAAPAPVASPTPSPLATASGTATPARRTGASAPARAIPAARSPFELASYQGALAKESYRILSPEIENGMQAALAARRADLRAATTVAEWKRVLVEATPSLAKAAAVLERRTEVLRGETRVADPYESPHTQRAAVYGLQTGLEKILALYGK